METLKEESWIGTKEAAQYLGVKPATIRDWIRKGKDIPRKKIGKAWKFKYSELEEWARSGRAADEYSPDWSFQAGRDFGITDQSGKKAVKTDQEDSDGWQAGL